MAALYPENIPEELKDSPSWVLWKKEAKPDGKIGKVPYQPNGQRAKSDDHSTWVKMDTALMAYQEIGGYDGICWMMPIEPGEIVFIDIDHCIKDGIIEPWAQAVVDRFNSYTEKSQSGNGLHILIRGKKPFKRCRKMGSPYEIYDCLRACFLTGDVVGECKTIEARQGPLVRLFEEIFGGTEPEPTRPQNITSAGKSSLSDGAVIAIMLGSSKANEIEALLRGDTTRHDRDDSAADLALCNHLAFFCGKDQVQMDRIFRKSKLMREKWDEQRGQSTYGEKTIRKACSGTTDTYTPPKEPAPKELWDAAPEEAEALLAAVMEERGMAPMSEEEFNAFKLDSGPKLTCNLPGDNFISRFMQYGSEISDAYRDYWFAGAIFVLAVATDKKLKFELGQDTIYTNVYIYIAGGSTLARKTTALKKSVRILEEAIGGRLGISKVPNEFSPEAFIEHMDQFNHAPWIRDEAAGVLSLMRKDYMRGFKDTLMQLYDCTPITRMLRTSQRNAEKTRFNIADPFLNVFFASTDAALGANTEANDALSGFLARFMFFYPQGEKDCYMPLRKGTARHSELEEIARGQLRGIVELMDSIFGCVDMNYTPDAQAYYEEWQERREKELARLKDGFSSQIFGRLMPAVVKLAMLFEVGSPGFNPSKPIGLASFQEACRLADEYFLPMSRAVYDLVGQTEEKNVIDKIVAYLKRNGGRATQRETARAIKIKSKELAEYLSTMLEYGMIDRREKDNGGKGRNQVYLFLREANDTNVSKVSNVTNVPDKECVMDSPGTLVTLVPLVTKETLEPIKRESNPEIDRIRAGHQKHVARKRTCCLCGRTFPYDLTYHANGDKSGYECTTCLMHGPPPEPEKANPQTKLEASG